LIVGLWPVTQLGSEFMPPLDEGDLMYMPTTYPGISIDKARELLQQTDKLIRTVPEVKRVFGKIGRAETATDPAPLTMVETVIQFKPRDEWRAGMTPDSLREELDELLQFPGLTNAWVMPIKTRIDMLATGIKTPVGIKVSGPDLSVIQSIGRDLERILAPVAGTASVYSERVAGGRYVDVDIDRARASRFGLNIDDVQDIVRTAIGGINVTQTVEGLERYPVNLRYPQRARDSVEQLRLLPIVTPQGARIALADVADVKVIDGPPVIKSENARLNGWTYVDISGRDLGSYVAEAQQHVASRLDLPAGYSLVWSGQYEYMVRAKERLSIVGPLGYDLSVAVGVGFIALAGVSVEIGVVMLVYLNLAIRQHLATAEAEGRALSMDDIRQAVIDGALLRVRPIMMTVAATIAGLLPIMLGSGTGSEVMRRIAAPMVGGMVSATILTLIVIPALFLIWRGRSLERAYSVDVAAAMPKE
jgi:Cu(I)/Ag(I) efflux system membrane protein CusA/SilA